MRPVDLRRSPRESMSLKKLRDFFDSDMLQLFDFERVLNDQMILFDLDAPRIS